MVPTLSAHSTRRCLQGHVEVVRYLLSVSADINAKRSGGFTALHLAGTVGVADALLRCGADRTLKSSAGKAPAEHCAGGATVQQFIGAFDPALIGTERAAPPAPAPAPTPSPSATPAYTSPRYSEPATTAALQQAPPPPAAQRSAAAAHALSSAGEAAMERDDYLLAYEKYSEAIAIDSRNPSHLTERAACCLKMSKFAEAKADAIAATRLAAGSEDGDDTRRRQAAEGLGYLRAAQACGGQGDYQEMRDMLDEAYERQPQLETAAMCVEAGEVALRAGRYMEAVIDAGAALGKNPTTQETSYTETDVLAYLVRADAQLAMDTERMYRKAIGDYEKAMLAAMAAGNDDRQLQRRTAMGLRTAQQKLAQIRGESQRRQFQRPPAAGGGSGKSLYAVLGVAESASDAEIKKAYHKLALQYHPDKHAGADEAVLDANEAKFKEVGEAYAVLGDAEKRRRYDQGGAVDLGEMMGGVGFSAHLLFELLFRAQMGQHMAGGGGGGAATGAMPATGGMRHGLFGQPRNGGLFGGGGGGGGLFTGSPDAGAFAPLAPTRYFLDRVAIESSACAVADLVARLDLT